MYSEEEANAVAEAQNLPTSIPYASADITVTTDTIDIVVRVLCLREGRGSGHP